MVTKEFNGWRSFPKGKAKVTVEESKTNWYVTIKPLYYEMPVTLGWKVTKRQAKTIDEAVNAIYNEYAGTPYCINKW